MLIHSKETQNQSQVNDTQGTQTLPEQQNADRKRTSISAFKKWQTGTWRNRRRQPDQSKGSEEKKNKRIFL